MKISDIIARVRASVGDLGSFQVTDTQINDWINDAVREVIVENGLLQKRATSSLVIGTGEYTLPTDILKLYSIYVNNFKIPVLTLQEWEELNFNLNAGEKGTPAQGYVFTDKLTLYPTPDTVVPLQINYLAMPTTVVYNVPDNATWLATVPAIPEAYHNRIVVYCIAQVALMDDDLVKYQTFMDQFKTGVINLKAALIDNEDDLYPFISPAGRDMGEWAGYGNSW